eukprot:8819549-Pyramimonas_sp.AAC.1
MDCVNAVIDTEKAVEDIAGVRPDTEVKDASQPKVNLMQTILDLGQEDQDSSRRRGPLGG